MKTLFVFLFFFSTIFANAQPPGNRGMYFDGVNDYVEVTKTSALTFSGTHDFTIELWAKPAKQASMTLFDNVANNDGSSIGMLNIWLHLEPDGKITAGLGKEGIGWDRIESNSTYEVNKWTHFAIVKQGITGLLYINGTLEKSVSLIYTPSAVINDVPINFGRLRREGNYYFNGQLDEIKVFNSARTADNIKADMSTVNNETGLVAYWNFEDDVNGVNATEVKNTTSGNDNGTSNGPLWALRVTDISDDISKAGTLRWAIDEANKDTDKDYIDFSIQQTSSATISTITTSVALSITKPIFLDGYSAYGSAPNTNTLSLGNNAAIRVEVFAKTYGQHGIVLSNVNNSLIRGLSIYGVPDDGTHKAGINVIGNDNQIAGCYIGLKANGSPYSNMNNVDLSGSNNTLGYIGMTPVPADFNIVCNSNYQGIQVEGGAGTTAIQGNYIGVGPDGKTAQGNYQLAINNFGVSTSIKNNVIGGNAYQYVIGGSGANAIIQGNLIGVGADGTTLVPNGNTGINLTSGTNALIGGDGKGEANIIAGNKGYGIVINGSATKAHLIKRNSIYGNISGGISLASGGNNNKAVPIITSATTATISGTGVAEDSIEVFSNLPIATGTNVQGKAYLGSAKVLADKSWSFSLASNFTLGDSITATATDAVNGTSEFSAAKVVGLPTPGAALDFDGVDDGVSLNLNINPSKNPSLTFEAWIYRRPNTGIWQAIVSNDDLGYDRALMVSLLDNNYHIFAGRDINTGIASTLNVWEHVAATWSAGRITFYKNGIQLFETVGETITTGTSSASIGYADIIENYYFAGLLDEVRFWNRELCQVEIANNMNCDSIPNKTNLLIQYSFNQGIAGGNNSVFVGDKIAIDSSGNNNNGTLSGFDLNGANSNWVSPGKIVSGSTCTLLVLPSSTIWTWTGAVSTDWFSPCNWDKLSVPVATSLVVIPGKHINNPEITGAGKIAKCKNLEIQTSTGAHLKLNKSSGASLNITH